MVKCELVLKVKSWNGEVHDVVFSEMSKSDHGCDHIKVDNYDNYINYINKTYPNLHTLDLDLMEDVNYKESKYKDEELLNPIDVAIYKGLNSPDDIFDSLSKSMYRFNYLGKYARIVKQFECGRNYVFSFKDFSLVLPFMKNLSGNAKRLYQLHRKSFENSRFAYNYKVYYNKSTNPFEKFDYELQCRSNFNKSIICVEDWEKIPGIEWSYLTVDKPTVELSNISYRNHYNEEEIWLNDNSRYVQTKPANTNKRYVYEKHLFCTKKGCPGSMDILLDCVHDIVIIKMINSHYECEDSQKQKIYEISRKLLVLCKGDLELMDKQFLLIPRRFGSTYIETFLASEEAKTFYKIDSTPPFMTYYYDKKNPEIKTWASQKTRNLENVLFHDYDTNDIVKKQKTTNSEIAEESIEKRDLINYSIKNWDLDSCRSNTFNHILIRDEWEYHINQNTENSVREIFRIFRKRYFGMTDFIRHFLNYCSLNFSLPIIEKYYRILNKYDNLMISREFPDLNSYFLNTLMIMSKRYEYCLNDLFFDEMFKLNFKDNRPLWNFESFNVPYPICDGIIEDKMTEFQKKIYENPKNAIVSEDFNDSFIFIGKSFNEMIECEEIFICQREIKLNDVLAEAEHLCDDLGDKYLNAITGEEYFDEVPRTIGSRFWCKKFPRFNFENIEGELKRKNHDHSVKEAELKFFKDSDFANFNNLVKLQIKYFKDDKINDCFVLCYRDSRFEFIKRILNKRESKKEVKIIILNSPDLELNEEGKSEVSDDNRYKIINFFQKCPNFVIDKLTESLEVNFLFMIEKGIINKEFEYEDIKKYLKNLLPVQRAHQLNPYFLNLGTKKRASIVGTARIFIKHLLELLEFLKNNINKWRIEDDNFSLYLDKINENKFKKDKLGNFSNKEILDILNFVMNNLKESEYSNEGYFEYFNKCIDLFLKDLENEKLVNVLNDHYRDLISLIDGLKKCVV